MARHRKPLLSVARSARLAEAAIPAMEKWKIKRYVLADKLNVSARHLRDMLTGTTRIGVGHANDLCFHLNLPVDEFVPQDNPPELLSMDLPTLQLLLTYLVGIDQFAPATAADLAGKIPRALQEQRGDVTLADILDEARTTYSDV